MIFDAGPFIRRAPLYTAAVEFVDADLRVITRNMVTIIAMIIMMAII
jgi:hypothetical protein